VGTKREKSNHYQKRFLGEKQKLSRLVRRRLGKNLAGRFGGQAIQKLCALSAGFKPASRKMFSREAKKKRRGKKGAETGEKRFQLDAAGTR